MIRRALRRLIGHVFVRPVQCIYLISGLHVALVGGWLYLLLLTPLRVVAALATKPMPVQKIAMLLSLGGVFSYGWLSGFNPPVMRAVVMAGLVSLAVLMSRRTMHFADIAWHIDPNHVGAAIIESTAGLLVVVHGGGCLMLGG